MRMDTLQAAREWFEQSRVKYEKLTKLVTGTLKASLKIKVLIIYQ